MTAPLGIRVALIESDHAVNFVRLCVNPRHSIAAKWEATLHWGLVAGAPELVCARCSVDLDFATTLLRSLTLTLVALL